jgi:hypothetical protein
MNRFNFIPLIVLPSIQTSRASFYHQTIAGITGGRNIKTLSLVPRGERQPTDLQANVGVLVHLTSCRMLGIYDPTAFIILASLFSLLS